MLILIVAQAVLVAQELNMDDLIEISLIAISIFLVLVLGALGIGLGHIIFVWCGVL